VTLYHVGLTIFISFLQDVFRLVTPGGGGYGIPEIGEVEKRSIAPAEDAVLRARGSVFDYSLRQESA